MLGSILVLMIMCSGFLIMIGAFKAGTKLLIFSLVLALLASLLTPLMSSIRTPNLSVWPYLILCGSILVILGMVRFINHRRKLESWIGEKRTSSKRRLERD